MQNLKNCQTRFTFDKSFFEKIYIRLHIIAHTVADKNGRPIMAYCKKSLSSVAPFHIGLRQLRSSNYLVTISVSLVTSVKYCISHKVPRRKVAEERT